MPFDLGLWLGLSLGEGLGFKVYGLGFGVWGLGSRVWGSRFGLVEGWGSSTRSV